MTLTEKIASKVKEKRLQYGWSQTVLADKSDITMRTIQNIESGKPSSPKVLEKIFEVLGIRMELIEINDKEL